MSSRTQPNMLLTETNPYLQLHAHDPVLWQIWGEKALETAKAEQKLLFVSIGYLACHWCHVMTDESFRDPQVAQLLNRSFVPILVDREERPDLDHYFMKVCRSLLDGSGGWPLNVILTPDCVPVFACIYLPKKSRGGGPGFLDVLNKFAHAWTRDPRSLVHDGRKILQNIQAQSATGATKKLAPDIFQQSLALLREEYDADYGGFGPEPKFVMPHRLSFLLNRYRKTADPELLAMVEQTCDAMRRGGVYDQVGAGIHRYSTDIFWFEPHFEKMLYDQAGLLEVYADLWQVTGNKKYRIAAQDVVGYLSREMTDAYGCFYAAEDADSEGKDGQFFLWRQQEILDVLGEPVGNNFCRVFGVTAKGNFRLASDGQGLNILARREDYSSLAKTLSLPEKELRDEMQQALGLLHARRKKRPAPAKDTLIVTAWNGLVISALAGAGRKLAQPSWVEMAGKAASFFAERLYADGVLRHSYLDGRGNTNAFASDYVYLAKGCLDLYAATFLRNWLELSIYLAAQAFERFWDSEGGGLLETADDGLSAMFASKSLEERDLPSVNAIALDLCCWLELVTAEQRWLAFADQLVAAFAGKVASDPMLYPSFLSAYGHFIEPIRKVVVAGSEHEPATAELCSAAQGHFAPETLMLLNAPHSSDKNLSDLNPSLGEMKPLQGRPAAYICDSNGCYAPLTDAEALRLQIAKTP